MITPMIFIKKRSTPKERSGLLFLVIARNIYFLIKNYTRYDVPSFDHYLMLVMSQSLNFFIE